MSVQMGKQYTSRNGGPVRVLCTDYADDQYPVIAVADGEPWFFTADGRYLDSGEHEYDLIESKEEPMFEVGKIYKTHAGGDVRIVCLDAEDKDYPVVGIMEGSPFTFTTRGKYYSDRVEPHAYDLQLPAGQYAHLKVDDPVWVRDSALDEWYPSHFAKVSVIGKVEVWFTGGTSFSAKDKGTLSYEYCWPYPNKPEL